MSKFINKQKKWHEIKNNSASCHYIGDKEFSSTLFENTKDTASPAEATANALKNIKEFSSGVIETQTHIIAWVDHIRTWPLFYSVQNDELLISNNAKALSQHCKKLTPNNLSCLEFAMSGYVTGEHTLYDEIKCIQPGEFLLWDKQNSQLTLKRYHQYIPNMSSQVDNWDKNKHALGQIMDELTLKIIERAEGRPIWIPLSGGMDSRIILCKLHEHGYKNLHSFTYGPRFNFESKIAKKLAKKLNVPWHFICPTKKQIRNYFESDTRKDFWNQTDGLKAILSMREFSALMNLREQNLIPDNAILINGQSGDYITGNHISKSWFEDGKFTEDNLFKTLYHKHYGWWKNLKTSQNFEALKKRMMNLLPESWTGAKAGIEWSTLEEVWEYDGRQVCLVANGQRAYDYFDYDWEMPLWNKALVDFCEPLPLKQKIGQALYLDYLKSYNYRGLFPQTEPYIWRWPAPMLWVIPAAQIIGLFKGRAAKDAFYNLMRYHGHYSNQYYAFPWALHKKTSPHTRNVMSLNIRQWIIENIELFPDDILKALDIKNVG